MSVLPCNLHALLDKVTTSQSLHTRNIDTHHMWRAQDKSLTESDKWPSKKNLSCYITATTVLFFWLFAFRICRKALLSASSATFFLLYLRIWPFICIVFVALTVNCLFFSQPLYNIPKYFCAWSSLLASHAYIKGGHTLSIMVN